MLKAVYDRDDNGKVDIAGVQKSLGKNPRGYYENVLSGGVHYHQIYLSW